MLDTENYIPRLRADYDSRIKAAMKEEFGYKNSMMVPRLDKIVLNIGCGAEAVKASKKSTSSHAHSSILTGQHAMITQAKNSIAGFPSSAVMPILPTATVAGTFLLEFLA